MPYFIRILRQARGSVSSQSSACSATHDRDGEHDRIAEPRVVRLSSLGGPSAVGVAPLVRGNVFYVADLRDGQGLVRRLGIDW